MGPGSTNRDADALGILHLPWRPPGYARLIRLSNVERSLFLTASPLYGDSDTPRVRRHLLTAVSHCHGDELLNDVYKPALRIWAQSKRIPQRHRIRGAVF